MILNIIPAYCTSALLYLCFIVYLILKWAYTNVDSFCTIVSLLCDLVKSFTVVQAYFVYIQVDRHIVDIDR